MELIDSSRKDSGPLSLSSRRRSLLENAQSISALLLLLLHLCCPSKSLERESLSSPSELKITTGIFDNRAKILFTETLIYLLLQSTTFKPFKALSCFRYYHACLQVLFSQYITSPNQL